jgi:NTP pyrophosphatase (non-canonical NTP hydrolase)
MNFKEYQVASRTTASYPNLGKSIEYPLMGLMGEFGEICEKFKKVLRDSNGVMTTERRDGLVGELGDLMWYLFQIYSEGKIDFEREYEEKQLFIEQASSSLNILVAMNCAISDIAMFCVSKNTVLLSCLTEPSNSLVACIKLICKICGSSIEEVMDKNTEKLKSRKERGVIKGDGDSR